MNKNIKSLSGFLASIIFITLLPCGAFGEFSILSSGWEEIIYDTYDGGISQSGLTYSLYDTSFAGGVSITTSGPNDLEEYVVHSLQFKGDNYNGGINGGIKIDITSFVNTGDALKLAYSYRGNHYSYESFIEVRSASNTVVSTFPFTTAPQSNVWVDFTSEVMPSITFNEGETVYLCFKQESGFWHIDNLSVSRQGASEAPVMEWMEKINDNFDDGISGSGILYSLYDVSFAGEVSITASAPDNSENYVVPALQFKGDGYQGGTNAGIKADITSLVTTGDTMKLEYSYRGDYYIFETFVEVRDENNAVVSTFPFTTAPKSNIWVDFSSGLMPVITFNEGETVYLCFKQKSGFWHVDNLVLWVGRVSDPSETPSATPDNTKRLTSSGIWKGSYFPVNPSSYSFANEFNASADINGVEAIRTADNMKITQQGGVLKFVTGEDVQNWNNSPVIAVKIPVNKASLTSGRQYKVYTALKTTFGEEIDIYMQSGTTKTTVDLGGQRVTANTQKVISGTVTVNFNSDDTLYIVIGQRSGDCEVDYIRFSEESDSIEIMDTATADLNSKPASVSVKFADGLMETLPVTWNEAAGTHIYYGTVNGISGAKAKLILVEEDKIPVIVSGVSGGYSVVEGVLGDKMEDNQFSVMVDDFVNLNVLSNITGDIFPALDSEASIPLKASYIGSDKVRFEGNLGSNNARKIVIMCVKASDGSLVLIEAVYTDDSGRYSMDSALSSSGSFSVTAGNLYNGISRSTDFNFATESAFIQLRADILSASDLSLLFEGDTEQARYNRIILGAGSYTIFDKLSKEGREFVYNKLKAGISEFDRLSAMNLFDVYTLVSSLSYASSSPDSELVSLIENEADELNISAIQAYKDFVSMTAARQSQIIAQLKLQKPDSDDSLYSVLIGQILKNQISNSGHTSSTLDILKNNSTVILNSQSDLSKLNTNVASLIGKSIASVIDIESLKTVVYNAIDKDGKDSGSTGTGSGTLSSPGGGSGGALYSNLPQNEPAVIPEQMADTKQYFNDLDNSLVWAVDSVNSLYEKGIINGFEDNSFRPYGLVTRAEFVKMLMSAYKLEDDTAASEFSDVPFDNWAYPYVSVAFRTGIVTGISDNWFGAGSSITRQDMSVISYRVLWQQGRVLKMSDAVFSDSGDISEYAKKAVGTLYENGIINGVGDSAFAPLEYATRAQAAVIISRMLNLN